LEQEIIAVGFQLWGVDIEIVMAIISIWVLDSLQEVQTIEDLNCFLLGILSIFLLPIQIEEMLFDA